MATREISDVEKTVHVYDVYYKLSSTDLISLLYLKKISTRIISVDIIPRSENATFFFFNFHIDVVCSVQLALFNLFMFTLSVHRLQLKEK